MSLQLNLEGKKPSDLTDDEYKILQDRGQLPRGWPFRPELVHNPDAPQMANTGTVRNLTDEQLEAELERRRAQQTLPTIGDKGGIQEDEDVPEELRGVSYDESPWTNESRRAELARRGLSVHGTKDVLIDRLERSDSDTLTDDDYDEDDEDDDE